MVMVNNHYMPGELADYGRKSFALAKERHIKSLEDQFAACAETREENGFPPASEGDQYAEPQNHGGDEWWVAHPEKGLDAMHSERTRPVLTALMLGVIEMRIKVIFVWSTDRIHRDVGIAQAFINLLIKHGVRLFDNHGEVPLSHPDAEAAYLNAAVAAQHYRKQCSKNSPRGIKRSAKKGIVVTDANTLGFRSGGRGSKIVVHIPKEQAKVNELYDWCLDGMSQNQIAQRLMEDGYQWAHDLHDKRGKQRNEFTRDVIYDWQVKRTLTDARYVGKQKQYGELWDCPAYLIDGVKPVVDPAKWEAVQAVINGRKNGGSAVKRTRPLTGIFRCGMCGQPLRAAPVSSQKQGGGGVQPRYWLPVKKSADSGYWCTHTLPSVREDSLDEYVLSTLTPLLLAEVRDGLLLEKGSEAVTDRAVILSQLRDAERYWEHVLPGFDTPDITPVSYARKEQACLKKIADLRLRLRETEAQVMSLGEVAAHMEDYSALPPEKQRDVLHAVVRWVALVPNYVPPELSRGNYVKRPDMNGSRIVVLTAFGTYHTATLSRSGGVRGRQFEIRPATPDEVIGTVGDFPDAECFLRGLERSWKGGRYAYSPDTVCPGYTRKPPLIAEFDLDAEVDG